jgi:hypothetical protein
MTTRRGLRVAACVALPERKAVAMPVVFPLVALDADLLRAVISALRKTGGAVVPLGCVCQVLRALAQEKKRDGFDISYLVQHLALLQWAVSYLKYEPGCNMFAEAAWGGHLEVLKWLCEKNCQRDNFTCSRAAMGGHLATLQWLRSKGFSWDECTCEEAAAAGHLEVLQWLVDNDCPCDAKVCMAAAEEGHLEVLQWAVGYGCPCDYTTCDAAAGRGHLEVLQWAVANGCPWDDHTCEAAAQADQVEVMQWAVSTECPWNKEACINAYRQMMQSMQVHGGLLPAHLGAANP